MFADNKYSKWYFDIIATARNRKTNVGYVETHHIVPSSIGGGDGKENKVVLTPREHFLCHLLLTKMTSGQDKYKMGFALSMMIKVQNIGEGRYSRINSRLFEYAKKEYRRAVSEYWTDARRKEHAKKISKATKGRTLTPEAIESYRNKVWTEKAIQNRLDNCKSNGAARKGKKFPEHAIRLFKNYAAKNKDLIMAVWKLGAQGLNRREISIQLGVSWDRVNKAFKARAELEKEYGTKK